MKINNTNQKETVKKWQKIHTGYLQAQNISKTAFAGLFGGVIGAMNYSGTLGDKASVFYAIGLLLLGISGGLFGHFMGKYNKSYFQKFLQNEIDWRIKHLINIQERKKPENISNEYAVVEGTKELSKVIENSERDKYIQSYEKLIEDIKAGIQDVKPNIDGDINKYFADMDRIDLLLDRINHLKNVIKDVEGNYNKLLDKYINELKIIMKQKFETVTGVLNSEIKELKFALLEISK